MESDRRPAGPERDDELLGVPDHAPIPAALHSSVTGLPFQQCLSCAGALEAAIYQIHKAWRGSECVLEAALCLPCLREMSTAYSQESLRVLRAFQRRVLDVWDADGCGACGVPAADLTAYSRVGVCRASALLRPVIVICADCEEEAQASLSPETRAAHDGFVRDHFPGIPADLEWQPSTRAPAFLF